MSGWLRGPKSPRAKQMLKLEAPALIRSKHVAPFALNQVSENPSLINIPAPEDGVLPDISHPAGALTADSRIRAIRLIDEIDRWYVQNRGDEAAVIGKIKGRLKGDRSEAWLKSLTTRNPNPLTVNKIRQRLFKDFRVEKWKELMELRYGEGASHEGQSYLSVANGGRMPEYFFGREFKLKLDYIEDIEKLREQVRAKNREIMLLESRIRGVEEARKAAEKKNEMQFEMSSEALARVAEIVINSVSGVENKKSEELERRRGEEDNRYHIMANHVITMGEEVDKLRDLVQKLQREGSSGIPTAVNSSTTTPRKLPGVEPYMAGSIASPTPCNTYSLLSHRNYGSPLTLDLVSLAMKDIGMNLLEERDGYAEEEKALKARLERYQGGGPIYLVKEDPPSDKDMARATGSASRNVSPPPVARGLEAEIAELLGEADGDGGCGGLLEEEAWRWS
ncbi:unnamed protein product [Tuber aestivum]|uniref:Uncharacterized protein n=1 Tax=Tuber aestivum TaxID=59557 RepID=A0A292PSB9_9PEZI|nr:unnamed protein product [Tuber aestivum]